MEQVKKMAVYALKKAIDYIEGKDSDVEKEKKTTAVRGRKSDKHQTRKPKRGRRLDKTLMSNLFFSQYTLSTVST